jgi:DNA processing protein
MEEKNYWLRFSVIPGIGPAKFRKLLEEFGSAKAAWIAKIEAPGSLLARINFSIGDYLKKLKEKDVWFLTLRDKEYPQILKQIKNPPFVIYGKGDPLTLSVRSGALIAVVGARRTTEYGREVTRILVSELALAGFTIVSGLALGVDAVSHMTALENNGKTIAVLGCGVDCCNPRENQSIYDDILKSGNCIISEFPLGMKPTLWSFPARNRIIAGLSQAVLVTEGTEDSGSLITAEFALKFNRKVFAVPGPITSQMSKGPYKLISKGAKLVTTAQDILKDLKCQISNIRTKSEISKIKGDTEEENLIIKLLQDESLHFDELVRRTKIISSKLSSTLSVMEIKGLVKNLGGGSWQLN